jgi:hypothetical protein
MAPIAADGVVVDPRALELGRDGIETWITHGKDLLW